ncbi:MAG: class I SAM-dependent rRNA methyltransferase [Planctomycetota bacterium]
MSSPESGPHVVLRERAAALARKGRAWFFRDDLGSGPPPGAGLVRVRDGRGADFGLGITSRSAKLALQLCGPWPGEGVPGPEEFFRRRLAEAVDRRLHGTLPRDGTRLVHGIADGLPGLVVDRYAGVLVLQVSAAAVERNLGCIVPFLVERFAPEMVLARNDIAVRRLEGLPQEILLLHGRRVTEVEIVEDGIRHRVLPFEGQKTGFYLDQAPARAAVRRLAKGRAVLDLFSYQGGFALAALAGGAASALAVDQSREALGRAEAAARANGLEGLRTECANVFDFLRRPDLGPFDLVILDPPAFAKSRRELPGALRGYRDLNRRALRILAPGGFLATCSCSHHLTLDRFESLVRQAAAGLPFRVLLRERIGAGGDHPVWLSMPETEYLKVLLLQRQG